MHSNMLNRHVVRAPRTGKAGITGRQQPVGAKRGPPPCRVITVPTLHPDADAEDSGATLARAKLAALHEQTAHGLPANHPDAVLEPLLGSFVAPTEPPQEQQQQQQEEATPEEGTLTRAVHIQAHTADESAVADSEAAEAPVAPASAECEAESLNSLNGTPLAATFKQGDMVLGRVVRANAMGARVALLDHAGAIGCGW
jgi:hypothetical protein